MLSNYDEAINCYSEAMTKEINIMNVGLLKRAIAFIEIKHYEDALDDLQALIANDPYNSEAFYFKGFILEKKSKKYGSKYSLISIKIFANTLNA